MDRLTQEQAAVIGLYTGYTAGPFEDIVALAEELMGRPISTMEYASEHCVPHLKDLVRPRYLALCYQEGEDR